MFGTEHVLAYLLFSFAFGGFWYQLLRRPHTDWIRMLSYPAVGVIAGEVVWAKYLPGGAEVLGIHVAVAAIATLVTVYLDISWQARRFVHLETLFSEIAGVTSTRIDRMPRVQVSAHMSHSHEANAEDHRKTA